MCVSWPPHVQFCPLTRQPLTSDELSLLYQALIDKFGTDKIAPGFTANGARILNFEIEDNKEYQKGIKEVVESLPNEFGGGIIDSAFYRSDGGFLKNDWRENKNGEVYRKNIEARRPDLQGASAGLQSRVEAVNQAYIEKYGWDQEGTALKQSFT